MVLDTPDIMKEKNKHTKTSSNKPNKRQKASSNSGLKAGFLNSASSSKKPEPPTPLALPLEQKPPPVNANSWADQKIGLNDLDSSADLSENFLTPPGNSLKISSSAAQPQQNVVPTSKKGNFIQPPAQTPTTSSTNEDGYTVLPLALRYYVKMQPNAFQGDSNKTKVSLILSILVKFPGYAGAQYNSRSRTIDLRFDTLADRKNFLDHAPHGFDITKAKLFDSSDNKPNKTSEVGRTL